LAKDPKKRLGHVKDLEEIKAHPWFSNINFNDMLAKKIPAPFKPLFQSTNSTEYFDEEFTSEDPINSFGSHVNPEILKEFDKEFQSVHYTK